MSQKGTVRNSDGAEQGRAGSSRPLLTLADLVPLVLVCLLALYAMSEVDKQKYRRAAAELYRIATGLRSRGDAARGKVPSSSPPAILAPPPGDLPATAPASAPKDPYAAFSSDRRFLVRLVDRGLEVSLAAVVAFNSGSAEVNREAVPLLETVAERLREPRHQIVLEGFTDDDPIHTRRFTSNQDLSVARAESVKALLVQYGVSSDRIRVAGYGADRPAFSNATQEGKARNRRVEIVVLGYRPAADTGQEIERSRK